MAKRIKMPSLGQSMEEGTIVRWFKAPGDTVVAGEPLYEVMTDKVTIEVESLESGILHKILSHVDSLVPVGDDIAIIGAPGDPIDPGNEGVPPSSDTTAIAATTSPATAAPVALARGRNRVHASPLAHRLAVEHGLDIASLIGCGTGPEGRILKRDILAYRDSSPVHPNVAQASPNVAQASLPVSSDFPAVAPASPPVPNLSQPEYTLVPLTGMRRMVADAIAKSATNPHVTLTIPVDMTEATRFRQQLLHVIEKSHGVRVSFTDLIAWATAHVLIEHPVVNSMLIGSEIHQYHAVHMGIAVSLGTSGLIVPVIRNAHQKSLGAISTSLKDLVSRAREGKLAAEEVTGGTFSITNLGTYGITQFNPIINPPQAAILGVCTIADTIVPIDGKPEVRPMMNLCLSFDHRITDGAPASAFLARLKAVLEQPYLLFA